MGSENETPRRFRTELTFRKEKQNRRWGLWTATGSLALLLGVALVFALVQMPFVHGSAWRARHDAAAALQSLQKGDLSALDQQLGAHRGQPDFAFYFTSQTTPRSLGDALASVASADGNAPLKAGVNTHAYDVDLTDLAGTLALATHGTDDRALPTSWTTDFIEATTTPASLFVEDNDAANGKAKRRADQDLANRQNLLLLLSRGYWSTGFLKSVTKAYWEFDHANSDSGWPGGTVSDTKYAPAPNGAYLTDGILALTAALTANSAASAWAFTGFQPGTETLSYGGSTQPIGKFTHYLFFEHHFPTSSSDSDRDSVGMTAALTALSSAIDATGGAAEAVDASSGNGPMADSLVLQGLAKSMHGGSGCSWNPRDYGHCALALAEAVWQWAQRWGHSVLDILSLATFAPPPIDAVGVGAAAANATWYAIDGDYSQAGLSLATAIPGLAFTKIAKSAKVAEAGVDAAQGAKALDTQAHVAKAAGELRAGVVVRDTRALAEDGALSIERSFQPLYFKEDAARDDLARALPGSMTERTFNPPGCTVSCLRKRRFDIFDPETSTGIEVKIGSTRNIAQARLEVQKDVALLREGNEVKSVVWRFFPDENGAIGPNNEIRTLLQANGIPYVMHLP